MSRPTVGIDLYAHVVVRRLVGGMVALLALLLVLDLTLVLGGGVATPDLRSVFDATHESGLMSFLCVTQVALVALTLAGMTVAFRHAGMARRRWLGWGALAVFFAYLAVDDGTRFHEAVGSAFAASAWGDDGPGNLFPSYYWQLTLGPLFATAGLLMLAFLWREMASPRRRAVVLAAFGLLAGAVALDFIEGLGTSHPLNGITTLSETGFVTAFSLVLGQAPLDVVTHEFRAVEEAMETLAFTLLWAAFLLHAADALGGVAVRFTAASREAPPSADLSGTVLDSPATPSAWIARAADAPTDRRVGALAEPDEVLA